MERNAIKKIIDFLSEDLKYNNEKAEGELREILVHEKSYVLERVLLIERMNREFLDEAYVKTVAELMELHRKCLLNSRQLKKDQLITAAIGAESMANAYKESIFIVMRLFGENDESLLIENFGGDDK